MEPSDELLREVLERARTIALVGASPNPVRPSHSVGRFLMGRGYRVIPVNPGHGGSQIWGQTVYPSLSAIPQEAAVDFVDVFRRSESVPPVVDEALEALPALQTIWLQLDIRHAEAAAKAEAAGVTVIQDRCPAIEYPRLLGMRRVAEPPGP